jgi:hypothetical protein
VTTVGTRYTGTMTATTQPSLSYAGAGLLLESLAAQDFVLLRSALDPGVRMRALVVPGVQVFDGPDAVVQKFVHWFGATESFEVLDASVGEVAGRIHLSWRIRMSADRLGTGAWIVEQQSYADCSETGRLRAIDLVCTGYLPERREQR